MSTHKNLMTVCCAAVLTFGLAACGSNGSVVKDDEPTVMIDTNGSVGMCGLRPRTMMNLRMRRPRLPTPTRRRHLWRR